MKKFLFILGMILVFPVSIFAGSFSDLEKLGTDPTIRILLYEGKSNQTIVIPSLSSLKNHWLKKNIQTTQEITIKLDNEKINLNFGGYSLQIPDSVFIEIPKDLTFTLNKKEYRGSFIIIKSENGFQIINYIELERYLLSVISAEIGIGRKSTDFEAVKCQSIAARTFTVDKMIHKKSDYKNYDILANTFDQVYEGVRSESPNYSVSIAETRGMVGIYKEALIQGLYHSTCGGQTENSESIWGGKRFDYLTSVYCGDGKNNFCSISPYFNWERELKINGRTHQIKNNLLKRLKPESVESFFSVNSIDSIYISERDSSGRVSMLSLKNRNGIFQINGDYIRWAFADENQNILPSNWFSMIPKYENGKIQSLTFKGRGFGHGLGMCQWGAIGMSRLGYNFEQIFKFYYRGSQILKIY